MWFVYALLSAFNSALVAIFAKIGLNNVQPVRAISIGSIILAIFSVTLCFWHDSKSILTMPPWTFKEWIFFSLAIIAGALSWLFYFLALKNGTASETLSVTTLSIVFTIFLSWLFLKEIITAKVIFGALMMIGGAVLIVLK